MGKNWFKDWFNTRYYHILYGNRDANEAAGFLDNILSLLKPQQASKMLDVACGKGRHSIYLNSKGFDVTGIDLSAESIAVAKKSENDRLHFRVEDMRLLQDEDVYDYAFNLFTSFGYFDDEGDNLLALKNICKALKPGGTFVFDYLNDIPAVNKLTGLEVKTIQGVQFTIRKEFDDRYIYKYIDVFDGAVEQKFMERVERFSIEKISDLLNAAGLQVEQTFGGHGLDDYDPATSQRMILFCKKPQ